MSKAEVIASAGTTSENGEYLLRRLPSWMPKAEDTGNFKLLDTVGRAIDRLDGDIRDIENANTVQHAESVPQLEELAKLVDLPSQESEPREKYRSRVIAEFQTMTTEGTPADVITNAATLLDVDPSAVKYTKLNEHGVVSLGVPGNALESQNISDTEFVQIITKHAAAGYRIEATIRGTFTYINPSDYHDGNHTADRGYTSLDTTGEPKDAGGTYAGLLE